MQQFNIRNINEKLYVFFNGTVFEFEFIEHYGNRLIGYTFDNKIIFIFENGKTYIYEQYNFFDNFIVVETNNLKGVYTRRGLPLIPAEYNFITFAARYIQCEKNDIGHMLYRYNGSLFTQTYVDHICYCENHFEVEIGNIKKIYSYEGKLLRTERTNQ